MAAPRSPSYPNISLSEAIAKAIQIYKKEHMAAMTPAVAAEAMGYGGVNGASLKTIGAVKKYGLLEGRGDGVRLTKDAQTLALDDPGSPEYRAALARAAAAPEVFGEINKQFQGAGSERNIAVFLEKAGYMPDAASTIAKHYKDAVALVSGNPVPYGGREDDAGEPPMSQTHAEQPAARPVGVSSAMPVAMAAPVAAGLPRVVQDGKLLSISAVVDLKGLRKLKLILNNYEQLLEMFEDGAEADLNIDQELKQ